LARPASAETRERAIVLALCAAAVARALALGAAFPLFNPIDEPLHFDLVVQYARGGPPRGVAPFSEESRRLLSIFASPDFVSASGKGPLWEDPAAVAAERFARRQDYWREHGNFESAQPPLYYVVAAAWYRLGSLLGFEEGRLVYWVRFLGAALLGVLVWLSHRWTRRLLPSGAYYGLGVPALVAFFPQQAAYSINNDALSPLVCGAAFFALVELTRARATARAAAAAGLLAAAGMLVKDTNVACVAIAAVVGLRLAEKGGASRRAAAALALGAGLPLLAEAAWNWARLGEPTGGVFKALVLGWTPRPLAAIPSHPLFTPRGLAHFLNELAVTFWRGEFAWRAAPLRSAALDAWYSASTWGLLALAALAIPRRRSVERDAAALGLFGLVVTVLVLAGLSVAYEFPECGYPTRAEPYLYSGRLVWGLLVPFAILYLQGLERVCALLRVNKLAALAAILLAVAAGEAAVAAPAETSRWNWRHLPPAAATRSLR